MSSGGAVSLPEEVRWVWVCVWGGVDGRSRASSVASVSNQALGRLLFVPGKEVWRRFIFWAEAGGINSPNEPEAIFYPQWPAMFPTSGRSVTQQHEVWAYYPGSYVPSGHLLSFGKSHWAQQPLEFRAIIIFCKKKRKITAKNEQVKKCLKARRLLQNKSSSRHCNPCALSTMYTLLTERVATGWVLEVRGAIQLSIVSISVLVWVSD